MGYQAANQCVRKFATFQLAASQKTREEIKLDLINDGVEEDLIDHMLDLIERSRQREWRKLLEEHIVNLSSPEPEAIVDENGSNSSDTSPEIKDYSEADPDDPE